MVVNGDSFTKNSFRTVEVVAMGNSLDLPDFDQLVKLAQEDPEALEALRKNLCEALIQQAPESYQRRLRGLQFKIDMERRRAKTPMAACIKLSSLMQDSFYKLRAALNEATNQQAAASAQATSGDTINVQVTAQAHKPTARVLNFTRK
jgi:hypothetical protein